MGNETKKSKEKELLLHMLFGTVIFLVLTGFAVLLDLVATWTGGLGVSALTTEALGWMAHIIMGMDLVMYAAYTGKTGWELLKELFK